MVELRSATTIPLGIGISQHYQKLFYQKRQFDNVT